MRHLVLGNGSLLIALDGAGQVRDLYFPYAGEELHTGPECVHRIGVWVDGALHWLSDPRWQVSVAYQKETLASAILAVNEALGIELRFTDAVYNERNIFVRRVLVTNAAHTARRIKLFFNQQLIISESARGNTAFYEPALQSVVHHRGRRVFLFSGTMNGAYFSQYAIGHFNSFGKEGTWRDAEDGVLGGNAIEHGKVDSTIGFEADVAAGDTAVLDYWMVAGETLPEVKREHSYLLAKTPDHLLETTQNYWRAWVNKYQYRFFGMSERAVRLFKTSLLVMRTHVDQRGGIIASCDADIARDGYDTYAYVWPRDAALATVAFVKAGYYEIARRFFSFAREVVSDEGYFYHKYTVSKSLGSSWHAWIKNGARRLPIQEDETALVLYALSVYYAHTKNIEFIEDLYNPLIKHCAEFLCAYRDLRTGLPRASYDLWEEKYGTTVFTASAVYGALTAARFFADLLGKEYDAARFQKAAAEVRHGILTHLMRHQKEVALHCVYEQDGRPPIDDTLDMSNLYGLVQFAVLPPDDARVRALRARMLHALAPKGGVGGVARHKNDTYFRSAAGVEGNPWFITTLWLAEVDIKAAKTAKDLEKATAYFDWVAAHALPSGVLAEQLDPFSGAPLSVAPLVWSHAEYVTAVILYLEKLEALGVCTTCYPVKVQE